VVAGKWKTSGTCDWPGMMSDALLPAESEITTQPLYAHDTPMLKDGGQTSVTLAQFGLGSFDQPTVTSGAGEVLVGGFIIQYSCSTHERQW